MPLNKIQMKFINSRIIHIFLLLFSSTTIIAQEIIRDTVVAPVKKVKKSKTKNRWYNCHCRRFYHFGFRYRQVLFELSSQVIQ
jgi:hypothetical protein